MGARMSFGVAVLGIVLLGVLPLVGGEKQTGTQAVGEDPAARGEYLVRFMGCGDCHSPKVMSEQGPVEDESRFLSGHPASEKVETGPNGLSPDGWMAACNPHMTAWAGPWGISFAANLTSDKKTGLGNWTEDQFIQAMRTGKHRGFGRPILPPMPWFNYLKGTDEDLKAMLAFLKSTRPIVNEVPPPVPPAGH